MTAVRAIAVAAAAAVIAIASSAPKYGDDVFRALRGGGDDATRLVGSGSDQPLAGAIGSGAIGSIHLGTEAHVESQLDAFVALVAGAGSASPRAAREAGVSATCDLLWTAYIEGRFPSNREWVKIATGAAVSAGLDVPAGSGAWIQLNRVKDATSSGISDRLGFVDEQKTESLAETLACSWA